jgi:hypothetical protein
VQVLDLIDGCGSDAEHFQLHVNDFVDEFRRASPRDRETMIAAGPEQCGRMEGLAAAVVSALSRETGTSAPGWLSRVASPEPFFVFPAESFALRLRLMLESPPPFRSRNVFVPEN